MHICGKIFTKEFLQSNPTTLGTYKNKQGQIISFLEHPILGEDAPVYATIHTHPDLLIYTGFYDIDDMIQPHEEYTPAFDKKGCLVMSADI